jgi:pyridoxal phosphate enzyme (YggS family)
MSVASNLLSVRDSLNANVQLIAVSKTYPASRILEAYNAGQRDFGENRVQEIQEKQALLPNDIRWHMIGTLQRNKVKYIAPFIALIHSIDSIDLLEEVNKQAAKNLRIINCLLQVYIAKEETKHGFLESEIVQLYQSAKLQKFENIQIVGLMGMASFTTDEQQVREEFKSLKDLFNTLNNSHQANLTVLSMGMSGDYRIAMEQGSTHVRIGSSIFGERT